MDYDATVRPLLPLLLLVACLVAAPASAGLFGTDAPARIPIPARVFRLQVEDVGGVVLEVDRATMDGEVYLFGRIGRADVTVPFENVVTVELLPGPDEDHRLARVEGARPVELVVEADRPIYGRTGFGNYRIELADVRRIRVLGERPREDGEQGPPR
jgi:hypothetical protein